jgi:HK97 gp10 family phage protein
MGKNSNHVRIVPVRGWERKIDGRPVLSPIATDIASDASRIAPRDTGFLANNIRVESVDDRSARVISEAPYSGHVEFGTSDTPAQPFLRPALYKKRGM